MLIVSDEGREIDLLPGARRLALLRAVGDDVIIKSHLKRRLHHAADATYGTIAAPLTKQLDKPQRGVRRPDVADALRYRKGSLRTAFSTKP